MVMMSQYFRASNLPNARTSFQDQVWRETLHFSEQLKLGAFSDDGFSSGVELEMSMLDENGLPAPNNASFVATKPHSMPVTTEVHDCGLEINTPPIDLKGSHFSSLQIQLEDIWKAARHHAHTLNNNLLMAGSMCSSTTQDITNAHLTPQKRYHAIHASMTKFRHGKAAYLDLKGREELNLLAPSLCLNGLANAFQVHLKIPSSQYRDYYNAMLMSLAPVLAISTNTPFILGKSIWEESRILSFEQMMTVKRKHRRNIRFSTFGNGYLKNSCADLFFDNYNRFRPLITDTNFDTDDEFHHLKQLNSTIFRWARPVIDSNAQKQLHLRIENRALPAGPTVVDMIANTAFSYGLLKALSDLGSDATKKLHFKYAKRNFYAAAEHGIAAQLHWFNKKTLSADKLIINELIPLAESGLHQLGIDSAEINYYLGIIEARAATQQTGSAWQRAFMKQPSRDFTELTQTYSVLQNSNQPVHTWPIR